MLCSLNDHWEVMLNEIAKLHSTQLELQELSIKECQIKHPGIRGSLMKPKWQKLASLAQKICRL